MKSRRKKKYLFDQSNNKNKELFYTIYNNMESKLSKNDSIFMITSLKQTSQMSSAIAYLGLAFSEQRKRVLIIDANLRQPTLHDVFSIENTWGFATVLLERKPQKIIEPVKISDFLYCLPTGQVLFEPSILFALELKPQILKLWKEQFDIILFHTSNCIDVPDAQIIAKHCDAVILVVQKGRSKVEDIREAKKQLEGNKHEISGTIMIS